MSNIPASFELGLLVPLILVRSPEDALVASTPEEHRALSPRGAIRRICQLAVFVRSNSMYRFRKFLLFELAVVLLEEVV